MPSDTAGNPDPATLASTACWYCRQEISPQDRFCRYCGKGQGSHVPWYYKHWGIILLTLFALGPFSLFLVWRSPLLSRQAKWIYTAVILIVTIYTCISIYNLWLKLSSLAGSLMQTGMLTPLQ